MSWRRRLHARLVDERRVHVLSERIAAQIPHGSSVLDVGCGDGRISARIAAARPDLTLDGVDVLARPETAIPVQIFDGERLPQADDSVDVVLFVDVLHHARDAVVLLREAMRVARRCIVLKDHNRNGLLAAPLLRWMDRVGNPAEVDFRDNYWPRERWREVFAELGLAVGSWEERLRLYPLPADWVFGRRLHFVARLDLP